MPKLTERQEVFCQEFAKCRNQTQAAIKAGYSKKNADVIATRLVRKSQVKARIEELSAKRAKRYDISAEKILRELARIGFANMRDFATWNESGVTMKESSELTAAQSAAVLEVSQVVTQHGGTTKVKLHDKAKALELLGKHLGLLKDRVEHSVDERLEDLIAGSMLEAREKEGESK